MRPLRRACKISCATALATAVCFSGSSVQAQERPNIVLVLADDLGVNDLACYGRADHRTPNLDRLATQGSRFTCAYCAQSICSPSRAALLTGKAPARLHLTTYLPGRADCRAQKLLHPAMRQELPLEEKTLAEQLHSAGYATACIGKWHLGGMGFGPREQGFEEYDSGEAVTKPSASEGSKGEFGLTAAAMRFVEANRERPFFLYLSHNSPHIPFAARADQLQRNATAFQPAYAAVIESLDDTVGKLLARLDELKLTRKTLVIFTSDNGGLHVPEGPHERVTHNAPFRAGKGFLYEGGLRVPLIVRWPGRVPADRVVDAPLVNTDWFPTLLELAGVPVPSGLDGVSFAGLLNGGATPPARKFYWHFPHYTNQGSRPAGAVRDGAWKLIEYYDSGRAELYNLDDDPRESTDLAAREPRRAAALRNALVAWRKAVGAQENIPNPDFDAATYRTLYEDFDASRFAPAVADESNWRRVRQWRTAMNRALGDRPVRSAR